jgi:Uma2 family endonuclease
MSATRLLDLVDDRAQVMRLTVDQYHQMIEGGILAEGEPYELLDGYVVRKDRSTAGEDPITVGSHHAWAVTNFGKLGRKLARLGCHLRAQQPIAAPPFNEPEPDGAIVAGGEDKYRERHPKAGEVMCAIEVADSSLARDRLKQRIYATAGIRQYVILNLQDRLVEVYTQPLPDKGRYGQCVTLPPGRAVEFHVSRGKKLSVPVKSLLP